MTRTRPVNREGLATTKVSRAQPSEGDRTTLRVPRDLMAAADRLAEEYGVSRNAALIALARRGREALAADAELEELRARIERAVLGVPSDSGADGFPSPEEYAAAILEPRGEEGSS
jgi:hypothetical protein